MHMKCSNGHQHHFSSISSLISYKESKAAQGWWILTAIYLSCLISTRYYLAAYIILSVESFINITYLILANTGVIDVYSRICRCYSRW